jgi:hypothetical protein
MPIAISTLPTFREWRRTRSLDRAATNPNYTLLQPPCVADHANEDAGALWGRLACVGVLIATADPLKHEQLKKGGQTSDCSTIVRNLRAALRIVDRHGLEMRAPASPDIERHLVAVGRRNQEKRKGRIDPG